MTIMAIVFVMFWVLFVTSGISLKKPKPVDHGYPKMSYPEE